MMLNLPRGCVSLIGINGKKGEKLRVYRVVCGVCYTRHHFSINEQEMARAKESQKAVRHVDLVRNHMRCTGWSFTGKYGWVDIETRECCGKDHDGFPPVYGITGGVVDEPNLIHLTILDPEILTPIHALAQR